MSIFNIFRKEKPANVNHDFDASDRDFSAEIRRQKAELRKLEFERQKIELQADIDDLKASLRDTEEPEESGSTDGMLAAVLLKLLSGQKGQATTEQQNPPFVSSPQLVHLSNEGLQEIKKTLPKMQLNILKKLPEADLQQMINAQFPNYDEDTKQRAINILKQ